jgi:hypothetical protein
MHPPRPSCRAHGWRLALLWSLAVHAALGVALYGLSGSGSTVATDSVQVDAVGLAPGAEEEPGNAFLVLPTPRQEVKNTLVPVTPPVPPAPAADSGGPEAPAPVASAVGIGGPSSPPAPAVPVPASPGNGGTGPGGATFFAVPAQAQSVVYVIDRSASMGLNGALAVARRELCRSLQNLPATARFQVVVYNRSAETLPLGGTGLVEAAPANVRRAVALLEELQPTGGTDHWPALLRALSLHPDILFFLTDADDLTPELLRRVTQLNRGRSVIHAVELNLANRDRDDLPMHRLARDNCGTYQAVDLDAYRN